MIIPYQQLSPEALNGIIEAFILQEGTDYGEQEVSFEVKKQQLFNQIQQGEVLVVFSELYQSVSLKLKEQFR